MLNVKVAEASPTVGAERGPVTFVHQNFITGHGDIFSAPYGRSDGVDSQIDVRYTVPAWADLEHHGGQSVQSVLGQFLNHVPTKGGNLQDHGVHLQLILQVI